MDYLYPLDNYSLIRGWINWGRIICGHGCGLLSSMSTLGPWPIFLSVHIHIQSLPSVSLVIFLRGNMESEQVGLG